MLRSDMIIGDDLEQEPRHADQSTTLRFLTCGSVDDGKSTLIGRLLWDCRCLTDDQIASLASDSRRFGTQGSEIDYSLLLDGLAAEREQRITIDVAYRYFQTARRSFIVADTPGHDQYVRNMVTGASTSSVAVIVVDCRGGVRPQTRRHSYLIAALGIKRVLLAVNKLDLVDYDRDVFAAIESQYKAFAASIGLHDVTCIPVSALRGDNVASRSANTTWFSGPTLIEYLERVETADVRQAAPARMLVQFVNRPHQDFRGFSGRLVSGVVRVGDRLRLAASGVESSIARLVASDGDRPYAVAGESITITLDDDIDASRGDMFVSPSAPASVADAFEATIIWMRDESMVPGRACWLKIGTMMVTASVAEPKYKLSIDSMERLAAKTLAMNEIGVCNVYLDRKVAFDPYAENRETGSFILIDRVTNDTIAAGLVHFALRRSANVHAQHGDVSKAARAALNGHRPAVVWFTGLSGAGKSTVANLLEVQLHRRGFHTFMLDGDNVRRGLNRDLGFTKADRIENIRRTIEVARLMVDAGLIVLVSFITPYRAERLLARESFESGEFCEVFVDAPLDVAEQRDPKGLYKKARRGELKNFTGIDSDYEVPERPDVRLDTVAMSAEQGAAAVMDRLVAMGVMKSR